MHSAKRYDQKILKETKNSVVKGQNGKTNELLTADKSQVEYLLAFEIIFPIFRNHVINYSVQDLDREVDEAYL